MRKGFEGFFGLVRDRLGEDPLSGHLFLFTNHTHTRLKALFWDGSGLWVCAKRLERGRFRWPQRKPEPASACGPKSSRCCSAGST
jgi:transposase